MKKTYILVPAGIMTLVLTISFAYAYDGMGPTNAEGDLLPVVLTLADVDLRANVYNETKNTNVNESKYKETLTSSTTVKIENNNKKEDAENASSTLKKDDDENFELDGDVERSNDDRGIIISNMAQVGTGTDLRDYVQSLVHENKDIVSVSMQEDRVSITRDMPARLLGFILTPSHETIEVISLGDGTKKINIDRPWWNIFSKNEIGSATLSNELEIRIKGIPASELKESLSISTKAFLISEIEKVLIGNTYSTSTINVSR